MFTETDAAVSPPVSFTVKHSHLCDTVCGTFMLIVCNTVFTETDGAVSPPVSFTVEQSHLCDTVCGTFMLMVCDTVCVH